MINKFVQWALSKLLPYYGPESSKDNHIKVNNWNKLKLHENEDSYGGQWDWYKLT